MRINKYLARQGATTRRGADRLIEEKKVRINGRIAVLGDHVSADDNVVVKGGPKQSELVYFAYHKERGVVSHSPEGRAIDIKKATSGAKDLVNTYPVGRLDRDSEGLMLLTNDGRIVKPLLTPSCDHEKEYEVKTRERLRDSFKKNMEKGVNIEGYTTRPCKVRVIDEHTFRIILTEGKKHQIRRMVSAMHNVVSSLKRIRIMNITLGNLPHGSHRPLKGPELQTLLKSLHLH
ncbi:MAG: 23S rRNA pseudouridine synthase F [Candidatus Vogelbacteria bacterium CG10_big_fil_rev_8_21_14_0_10_45_14]|uniref:Pseudouridine synthase n=1 Tax=Candidatus Vogelbacteria bacterium CG10_big_fil_rev_8_21_14_0_10_45_14 TaxID=1975042 RepID=A0A2H0RL31_9BACT|nr:MAG: 23S rRNA pseudouridine synthase F [Candidatus Vogelbacteria bacterium CG10_big_fil_rev_8_21_14_0_10_45_14]